MVLGFVFLFMKYRKAGGMLKSQLQFIMLGSFVSTLLGGLLNLLLPISGHYELVWLGPSFSLFLVGCIAYSIVVHRLMDIKFALRRSSVYISSLVSVFLISIFLRWFSEIYFSVYSSWFDLVILVVAITLFPGIKSRYYRLANKYFFSALYDGQKLIGELTDSLRSTLNVRKIYNFIFKSIDNSLHIKSFGVLSSVAETGNYRVAYNQNFLIKNSVEFVGNRFLYNKFIRQNKPMIIDELDAHFRNKDTEKIIDLLMDSKVEILIPMNIKGNTVGLLAFGAKESEDMYTDEDLRVLEIVGAQAAIAIENATLYEEAQQFNARLQDEVEKATANLRSANVRLKKLDEAKSEFISIASHQLRTPLTVIKGYISMILEKAFGDLTPEEEDSLTKVYDSNERLIKLVENLLNISRIESGRLQFNYEVMQLEDLVASVFEELQNPAKDKKLKFSLKKPKKKMPAVKMDEEKIRQVIMNLTDNAIKYTQKGAVTLTLSLLKDEKQIKFCVKDSGMGIGSDDIDNLFKKFSRGSGTALVHTEGTGLGLYVAKQMIEAHKGSIWVESGGEGKGSQFCFIIPIA